MISIGMSKVGLVRTHNEDRFLVSDKLCIVTDGMGGYSGGEIASTYAIDEIRTSLEQVDSYSEEALAKAIQEGNNRIVHRADGDPSLDGMGTTVVIAALEGMCLYWAHVGDSRLYLFRHGNLSQVTTDHSLVQALYEAGEISKDEMAKHPKRNMLTRAVGVEPTVEVDTGTIDLEPGDRILLCTDGLTEYVSDYVIEGVLEEKRDNKDAIDALMQLVYDGGAGDNVTIVVGTI